MAPTNFKTITVVGGTGPVGSIFVRALLRTKEFDVRVLTRASSTNSETAQSLAAQGAKLVPVNSYIDSESLTTALKGTDVVLITLGQSPSALEAELHVISAAATVGVKRIIPSEFGADHSAEKLRVHAPVRNAWDGKEEVFEVVKQSEIPYTAIINGCFLEDTFGPWFGFGLKEGEWKVVGDGEKKATFTSFENVASTIIQVIKDTRFANRRLTIAGDMVTLNEACAEFEKAQGKSLKKVFIPTEQAEKDLRENYTFEKHLTIALGDGSLDYSINDNEDVNPGESLWKWDKLAEYAAKNPLGYMTNH